MMLTLYNSISNLNDFADEATYRLNGKVEMNGPRNIGLATMQATGDMPLPAPMALAWWLGDKFNRLYLNNVNTPDVKSVNVTVDLLPERRVAAIESAWVANTDVQAGEEVPVKVSCGRIAASRSSANSSSRFRRGWPRATTGFC